MPLVDLLPLLKDLSYTDKLVLLNFLVTELLQESGIVPSSDRDSVSGQGLENSFEAAAVLAKALAEAKVTTNG